MDIDKPAEEEDETPIDRQINLIDIDKPDRQIDKPDRQIDKPDRQIDR